MGLLDWLVLIYVGGVLRYNEIGKLAMHYWLTRFKSQWRPICAFLIVTKVHTVTIWEVTVKRSNVSVSIYPIYSWTHTNNIIFPCGQHGNLCYGTFQLWMIIQKGFEVFHDSFVLNQQKAKCKRVTSRWIPFLANLYFQKPLFNSKCCIRVAILFK